VDAGAVIRSRNGDIPKGRFTLDSIMVASSHAELDLTTSPPLVRNLAGSCFSFVRRDVGDETTWIPLSRVERSIGEQVTELKVGDELYIGNCILRVDGATAGPKLASQAAPPPMEFSLADELPFVLGDLPLPPPPLLASSSEPESAPAAEAVATPPPLPASHRGSGSLGISNTWMEAPSVQLSPVAVEDSPRASVGAPSGADSETTAEYPSPTSPASVDEAWSPVDAFADDPTNVPLPRFMRDQKP
jgi:hypothetical protein